MPLALSRGSALRRGTALTLLAILAAGAHAQHAQAPTGGTATIPPAPRTTARAVPGDAYCAFPSPTPEERAAVRAELDAFLARHGGTVEAGGPVTVPVAFHVLRQGDGTDNGDIPQAWIDAQIALLNDAFGGATGGYETNFRFVLDVVTRTTNAAWYTQCIGPSHLPMKEALHHSPATHLNVYSCRTPAGHWGESTFPSLFPEDDYRHGIVILDQSLPGGSAVPYNEGITAVHEVGHYLGLYHTFQNFGNPCEGGDAPPGCETGGDEVCDTAAEASAALGCPVGRDTCPTGGPDPIHNFMDYTDDPCRYEFTAGQSERMDQMVALYKPTLLLGGGGCEQSLSATLDDTTPAPGQVITFNVTVANNDNAPAPLDLWLVADGPVDRTVRLGRGTLPAGATVTRNVRLRIPGNTPSGTYALDLNIGGFPSDVCDTVEFTLTVSAPATGGGTEFEVLDDFFAAEASASGPSVAPNPFARQTQISYEAAAATDVRLAVYDVLGREVAVLVDGRQEAGAHRATFDASGLAAGTYVYRLTVGSEVQTGRLTLTR